MTNRVCSEPSPFLTFSKKILSLKMLMLEPLSNMVKYILDTFASRLVNTYTVTTKHVVYTLVFSLAVVSGPTTSSTIVRKLRYWLVRSQLELKRTDIISLLLSLQKLLVH